MTSEPVRRARGRPKKVWDGEPKRSRGRPKLPLRHDPDRYLLALAQGHVAAVRITGDKVSALRIYETLTAVKYGSIEWSRDNVARLLEGKAYKVIFTSPQRN